MSSFIFEELIEQAQEIENGIKYLKAKVIEPTKLGNGNANSALRKINEEICSLMEETKQSIEERQKEYDSIVETRKMVSSYLDKMGESLDRIEEECTTQCDYKSYEISKMARKKINCSYMEMSGVMGLPSSNETPCLYSNINRRLKFENSLRNLTSTPYKDSVPNVTITTPKGVFLCKTDTTPHLKTNWQRSKQ